MFHRIKSVQPMSDFQIIVQFMEGITKLYDITPLFKKWPGFKTLKKDPRIFEDVKVDIGGYGIFWSDNIDLSCDELYENGEVINTSFDRQSVGERNQMIEEALSKLY